MAYLKSKILARSLQMCKSFKIIQNKTRSNENDIIYNDRAAIKPYFAGPRVIFELHNMGE